MTARTVLAALGAASSWLAAPAHAERPALPGEATYGVPAGQVLVHYATTGVDAAPATDADADGVRDFVEEVALTAEDALARFLALGFRRPLDDGALGGDGRIDIYLRDLQAADGNAGTDRCDGDRCIGFISAENDYAGFAYPSTTEAIRSVIPHELFHLVQNAYSSAQPATWTEGSAVWSVEHLYGDGNSDFERFLPAFVTRSYRPFERPVGGFGDAYPYGAALWPYFLERRFGVAAVVATWAACETQFFLDATPSDAFVEFTRWNLFTGTRASGGPYPAAAAWREVPLEPTLAEGGVVYLEGLSARYVPLTIASPTRVTVSPPSNLAIAAWIVAEGDVFEHGVELTGAGSRLATDLDGGAYTLVVTGLTRNSITTAVDVTFAAPDNDGGGCSTTGTGSAWLAICLLGLKLRRPRSPR
jgi:hypothetical protein